MQQVASGGQGVGRNQALAVSPGSLTLAAP